ncbi:hypothetical protein GCT13_14985 [Paraburkholderia sp. CNPSo 3157]|uniref:Transposon Tn7 transposition protein TnsD C-termianl domain-containing protein n=1 Tax=Paraburkholderia franconis TaxID=2654983 RepID=A0A7X1NA30_9BURK|nr:hypothetical protein [Paraburkholderia franconis]
MGRWIPNIPRFIKQCPECVRDDMEKYGETYFRRLHQLPGVVCCVVHRCVLFETHHPYRRGTRDAISVPNSRGLLRPCVENLSKPTFERHVFFASECQKLLDRRLEDCRWRVRSGYAKRAFAIGYRYRYLVDRYGLEKDILDFYGQDFLDSVGFHLKVANDENWVQRLLSPSASSSSGVATNLLLDNFLTVAESRRKAPSLRPPPWTCQNSCAPHYGQSVVETMRMARRCDGNRRVSGRFMCSCGYIFLAYLDSVDKNGEPLVDRIIEYGPYVAQRARELREAGISLKEVAHRLNMSKDSVKRILQFPVAATGTCTLGNTGGAKISP